ncbi:MAG: sigma-70 family RNA polymerase sigma factor [Thermomicrobiales bacterium]
MAAGRGEQVEEPAEQPRRHRLDAVKGTDTAPYDDPILRQIQESVQRIAAAALRDAPSSDVLLSAEDIAQDTMATLNQRGQPATANSLAWAVGIAKFKLKEAMRRSRAQVPQVPLPDEDLIGSGDPDAQVVGIMHYVWLLDQIAPVDRMIVEWRQAGYSSREIAEELQRVGYPQMTANNVDQRFYRALKTLRARLFAEEAL